MFVFVITRNTNSRFVFSNVKNSVQLLLFYDCLLNVFMLSYFFGFFIFEETFCTFLTINLKWKCIYSPFILLKLHRRRITISML